MEIKNKLTVTRGEGGEDNGGKGKRGEGSSSNMYKGPMDKAQGGVGSMVAGRDGWNEGSGGEKMETTVLEQQ